LLSIVALMFVTVTTHCLEHQDLKDFLEQRRAYDQLFGFSLGYGLGIIGGLAVNETKKISMDQRLKSFDATVLILLLSGMFVSIIMSGKYERKATALMDRLENQRRPFRFTNDELSLENRRAMCGFAKGMVQGAGFGYMSAQVCVVAEELSLVLR